MTDAGATDTEALGGVRTAPDPRSPWEWRYCMARRIAASLEPERLGVVACYLIGSAKNATAGPGSDLDLMIHVRATPAQRAALGRQLGAWSRWLGMVNFLYTGARTVELLDVHLVTDEDIAHRTSYTVKIGGIDDGAHALPLGSAASAPAAPTPRPRGPRGDSR